MKKKRSAKQLANDKRLGRMAKKRAANARKTNPKRKKRKKRAKRRNPSTLRARQTAIQRATNPKRKKLAKSHLWLVFACKGKIVQWLYLTGKAKPFFIGDKGKAVRFTTKGAAFNTAKGVKGTRGWQLGAVSDDTTSAQIAAGCQKGKT